MTVDTADDTGAEVADLVVDPDLTAMIGDVLSRFSGPTAPPDPAAVWRTSPRWDWPGSPPRRDPAEVAPDGRKRRP